jgi:hypothetical protein
MVARGHHVRHARHDFLHLFHPLVSLLPSMVCQVVGQVACVDDEVEGARAE